MDLGSPTKGAAPTKGDQYDEVIETMQDSEQSSFAFVTYPEFIPMTGAYRAAAELQEQVGSRRPSSSQTIFCCRSTATTLSSPTDGSNRKKYLGETKNRFETPIMLAPLHQDEPVGLEELRAFGDEITGLAELTNEQEVRVS